jgi:molybdate transport system substrate-binding protein
MRWIGRTVAAMMGVLAAATAPAQDRPAEVTVFAAASLQNALVDVGRLYEQKTQRTVRFSFAATSALARQIEQGAPAGAMRYPIVA